jgi:monovalent cation/hydrogen antiporter
MTALHHVEIAVALAIAVLAVTDIARRWLLPYPILLVLGGLLLAVVPGLPRLRLHPDLVFLVVLPPILWSAAFFTSQRDFRRNFRPIALLAIGLVLATTAAVAAVAHAAIPGIGWPAAIVLGAIVSPPDAIAASAIARHLRIPARVVTILEGESLVNDATALILYRTSVAVAAGGAFTWHGALIDFALAAVLGIGTGLMVGWLVSLALRLVVERSGQILLTLIAPYAAWIIAERIGGSAVLSCVVGGFYLRRHFSRAIAPATRLQARAVWEFVTFALNALVFILLGLQLALIREQVSIAIWMSLIQEGLLVSVVAIIVRLAWVPMAAALPRWLIPALRRSDPMPPWQPIFLIGWTGMRGIVSLAAALALPLTTLSGAPFPERDRLIVITFVVILVTLVAQGLTLAPLIRRMRFDEDDTPQREESLARRHGAERAVARLEELRGEPWVQASHAERILARYARQLDADAHPDDEQLYAFRRLRFETLAAERHALIELRDHGEIGDDLLHELERELDLEAMRYGLGGQAP